MKGFSVLLLFLNLWNAELKSIEKFKLQAEPKFGRLCRVLRTSPAYLTEIATAVRTIILVTNKGGYIGEIDQVQPNDE